MNKRKEETRMTKKHPMHHDRLATLLIGATLAFAVPATAFAQTEARADADAWQFELTPDLFAANLKGTVGTSHVTAKIDLSFSDALDVLEAGFMALFEARKGPWTFAFETVYMKLGEVPAKSWQGPLGSTNTGSLDATMAMQLYQPSVGYRVLNEQTKVDVIGAVRYTRLDTDLNLVVTTGSPLLPDGSRSISGKQNWWDPVIGVRVLHPLNEEWTLVGYADVGGFGAGSDITYQFLGGVNWQFSKSVSAKFGYRYLYQDYVNDDFVWDMAASGFYLGFGFRF
jgi:hypothetical protein